MNLEDSDLGEDYVDGATWQMLPGLPAARIAAPTATGACDTTVICIKTVRFQITINASAEVFVFGVIDDADVSNSKYKYRSDDIIYLFIQPVARCGHLQRLCCCLLKQDNICSHM